MGLFKSSAAVAWLVGAAVLAGCTTSSRQFPPADVGTPLPPVAPVESTVIERGSLPPVGEGGQRPVDATGQPSGTGTRTLDAMGVPLDAAPAGTEGSGLPEGTAADTMGSAGSQTGEDNTSFVTLDDLQSGGTVAGRNLSGELTVEKLLGGWTIDDGINSCRLNLTYTAKGETGRYRASAPGCQVAGVAAVSSWDLAGGQIRLFTESGQLIAALVLSGERFVGTLADGRRVTMAG